MNSANYTAWPRFAVDAEPELRRFESSLKSPRDAQQDRLRQILRENVDTHFGREHGFDTVQSIRDFQDRVPVTDWSSVEPLVDRVKAGETRVLTHEDPVHFERTSGSGARRKDIPYTKALLREFQNAVVVWLAALERGCPAVAGPSYWSLSPDPSPPETTATGATVGSAGDAAYLSGCAAENLLSTVIGPGALRRGTGDWRLETLGMIASEADLRLFSVWSPTFLLSLFDVVFDETCASSNMDALRKIVPRDRYPALSRAVEQRDFSRLWPMLQVISCWTDGPSTGYCAELGRLFPGCRVVPKGLIATEGVVSISWGMTSTRPVAITSHFLEFVDESGSPRVVDDVEAGRRYRPLLTTSGGLYRYCLGDVIEVDDFMEGTPCVRFVGRDDHRSDLVGEKLDEGIVSGAFRAAALHEPAVLVPIARAHPARYLLLTQSGDETAAGNVENALIQAHHYSIARRNGQLAAVSACIVDSLSGLIHDAWQATGHRSGDAKPVSLVTSAELAASLVRILQDRSGTALQ